MKKIPVLYDMLIVYVDIPYGKQYKGVSLVAIFGSFYRWELWITCDFASLISLNIRPVKLKNQVETISNLYIQANRAMA